MKNSKDYDLKLNYQSNYVKSSTNTKFLAMTIDVSLSWKAHRDQMMSKLNTACCVIRTLKAIMSQETLRMVYFAHVHSIISGGKPTT
jgi:NADH:ubiquinone oxidoreductase subunit B-like Fe-S oxidoreductase